MQLIAHHMQISSCLWYVLQYYPLEEVLAAEYLLEDFRPDLIEMVLDKLRPENVRSVWWNQTGRGQKSWRLKKNNKNTVKTASLF